MSTPYAGANFFPATIPIPSDGDLKNAATVGAALEGLMDACVSLAFQHLGVNPAGILKTPTIRANASYQRDGAARAHDFVDVAITFNDLCNFTINGPAATSPTVTISRNINWPEGNHTFGGQLGQTISYSCPQFFSQPQSPFGAGRVRVRKQNSTTLGAANQAINPVTTDVFIVREGDITNGALGVVANGSHDGSLSSWDVIRIVSQSANGLVLREADTVTAIADQNLTPIVMKRNPAVAGEYSSVLLIWNGSAWIMIGR
jgi:hypothetical protein